MAFPIMAAAVGAGALASYFGQKETNAANLQMNQQTNDTNAALAAQNREWQERMANTAHTREVKDLREAGLNPILSASGGSGAATPSGSVATMQAGRMENALGAGINSAMQSASLQKDLEMADSQKALNASAMETQTTQQSLNAASAVKAREDALVSMQKYRESDLTQEQQKMSNDVQAVNMSVAREQAKADLKRAQMDNKMATFDAIQKRVDNAFGTANSAKDLINPFKGLFNNKNIPPAGEIFKNRQGQEGFYDRDGKFHKTR